jgi:hypothetical protein
MSKTGQRTHETKRCAWCGRTFTKLTKLSRAQWAGAMFCSNSCHGAAQRGETIDKAGRVKIWHNNRKQWRSHVVIEQLLRRQLMPDEVVHHIDGDPSNDSPSNLRVFASHAEHMSNHWSEGTIVRVPGKRGVTRAVSRPAR